MTELETIIQQCKKSDRAAQFRLYGLLAPKLLGIALRYMQNRDEAEDVMQDSFVKIFSSIKSFKGEGSFEGWARRITVNTALTALKSKHRIYFERNLELVENIDISNEEQQHIGVDDIMACMDELPMGYRTIINLFLVEEFSHKEIAEKLNIGESTSRSQYARARQQLLKLVKVRSEQMTKNAQ